jgi:hypothetical protein
MASKNPYPEHVKNFFDNLREVRELIDIHETVAGKGQGRKSKVETLNKSGIVFLTACWETFVEELLSSAFKYLVENADDHRSIPFGVLTKASHDLKNDKDARRVWQLAGDGWKNILTTYGEKILKGHIDYFHVPRPGNIDELFENLIGLQNPTSKWKWKKMSNQKARATLNKFIDLRGSIAHKVKSSEKVYKKDVTYYYTFLNCVGVILHNVTSDHLENLIGKTPWIPYVYKTIG